MLAIASLGGITNDKYRRVGIPPSFRVKSYNGRPAVFASQRPSPAAIATPTHVQFLEQQITNMNFRRRSVNPGKAN